MGTRAYATASLGLQHQHQPHCWPAGPPHQRTLLEGALVGGAPRRRRQLCAERRPLCLLRAPALKDARVVVLYFAAAVAARA